jgi:hypothetical protein
LKTLSEKMEALIRNLRLFQRTQAFFKIISRYIQVFVGNFERFRGFLSTFSRKWRLLFRNVRIL